MSCEFPAQNNTTSANIIPSFEESFDNYSGSDHCRSSNIIKENIKKHFVQELTKNIHNYERKTFEDIFKLVYSKITLLL